MTCETCKHWIENTTEAYPFRIGVCAAVKMFWDCTEWNDIDDRRHFKPEYANNLAFAQDGSDYIARLLTRPKFHCNQFAERV